MTRTGHRPTRAQLLAAGLCRNYLRCENARGKDGTTIECRPCADERNELNAGRLRVKRGEWAAEGLCLQCGGRRDNETQLCNTCRDLKALYDRASYLQASQQPS
jgi:hypothetical protein